MQPLLLVGAGGFGREVAEAVHAINNVRPTWELLGFLDDEYERLGLDVDGTPVIGPIFAVERFPEAQVVICTGNPANYFSRKRLVRRLALEPSRYATLIHPSAMVPAIAITGPGSVLLATAVITSKVRLGAHVAVMPGVVITHDCRVGDYVTMGAGVRLAGAVQIGEGAYVGAGATVREGLSIGPWALLGMGSVVVDDVPGGEVWAGVPARPLRTVEVPDDVAVWV